MSLNFTLLTERQILGFSIFGHKFGQLESIKKYGASTQPTDLALILGLDRDRLCSGYLTWTSTKCWEDCVVDPLRLVSIFAGKNRHMYTSPHSRGIGTRPVLLPSETKKLQPVQRTKTEDGVDVVEYGEYPQTIVDDKIANELENALEQGKLTKTGKSYTFDSHDINYWPFDAEVCPEYEHEGKKYIHIEGRHCDSGRLSNGEYVKASRSYWVEVQPIEWFADKDGTWVSKKILFSGIPLDESKQYDCRFKRTFMKHYLDTYFAKEMGHEERLVMLEREREIKQLQSDENLSKQKIELSNLPSEEKEKLLKELHERRVKDLKAKLAEAIDPEKVKEKVGDARTPERRQIAEAIKTTRRARDVFVAAGKQAQKEGDQELIEQIVEMADFYVRSDQAQRGAARQRRAEYRAKRTAAKKGSER